MNNEMDRETRLALIGKAEQFAVEYSAKYWAAKKPPEQQKFVHACIIIEELVGLVVHLLDWEAEPCE